MSTTNIYIPFFAGGGLGVDHPNLCIGVLFGGCGRTIHGFLPGLPGGFCSSTGFKPIDLPQKDTYAPARFLVFTEAKKKWKLPEAAEDFFEMEKRYKRDNTRCFQLLRKDHGSGFESSKPGRKKTNKTGPTKKRHNPRIPTPKTSLKFPETSYSQADLRNVRGTPGMRPDDIFQQHAFACQVLPRKPRNPTPEP